MLIRIFTICLVTSLLMTPLSAQTRREKEQKKIAQLIEQVKTKHPFREPVELTTAIKGLHDIGEPAVVPLIKALDEAENDLAMRGIGFTLRSIGDPRAIPALIRAIPRTLLKPGSDLGCRVEDDELLEFMMKHDNDKENSDRNFSYNRPVREICETLRKISKTTHDEKGIYSVFLGGGEVSQYYQKRQYYEVAKNWANWWDKNSSDFVMNPIYQKTNLPSFDLMEPAVLSGVGFPKDKPLRIGDGRSGWTIEPIQESKRSGFIDLESMKVSGRPKKFFPEGTMDPDSVLTKKRGEILKHARKNGFDLMCEEVEIEDEGVKKKIFVPKMISGTVWRVDDDAWENLSTHLSKKDFPGKQTVTELIAKDAKTKKYLPNESAVFVYKTGEGSMGIIRIGGQITEAITIDEVRASGGFKKHQGFSVGVKFDLKKIYIEP